MAQEVETFMRQRVHGAFLQVLKHKRLFPRVPALLVITGGYARPVLEGEGWRHFHIDTGPDPVTAFQGA